jgi:predicted transposase YdaD
VEQVLHSVMDEQRAEELMRSYGEELMERGRQQGLTQGLAQGREEGRTQGRLRGRAEDVLRILAARGLHVDPQARQRILSCSEESTLDRRFDTALHATSLSEVLDAWTQ